MAKAKSQSTKADATTGLGMVGGAAAGAAAGSFVGPMGAAVGAVVGGIAGANARELVRSKPVKKLTAAVGKATKKIAKGSTKKLAQLPAKMSLAKPTATKKKAAPKKKVATKTSKKKK